LVTKPSIAPKTAGRSHPPDKSWWTCPTSSPGSTAIPHLRGAVADSRYAAHRIHPKLRFASPWAASAVTINDYGDRVPRPSRTVLDGLGAVWTGRSVCGLWAAQGRRSGPDPDWEGAYEILPSGLVGPVATVLPQELAGLRRASGRIGKEGPVVGGAKRGEAKRKQLAAQAVTAARRSGGPSRGAVAAVAIVVALVLVVGLGLWLQNRKKPDDLPAAIPVAAAGPEYPVTLQGDTVVTGSPQAPVTIDIYEDFLCLSCAEFENLYHSQLAQAAADGEARVVYHPVAILDDYSEPAGYSTLAAGATFCAAQAGIFPRFHDSLFATQPAQGGPGWASAQLQQLARDLGAGDGVARCMQAGTDRRVAASTEIARRFISGLRLDGRFDTPSVVVNGTLVDIGDQGWLEQALSRAQR
jgi:protein-disulfide isomerase